MARAALEAIEKRIIDARRKMADELEQQLLELCDKCPYRQFSQEFSGRVDRLEREVEELKRK